MEDGVRGGGGRNRGSHKNEKESQIRMRHLDKNKTGSKQPTAKD